ncbi:MAG TPA: hypothetical protein VKB58_13710 [Terriglobales bacterium]|nr:hypothetical protein [Terriglobales bacterium]
MRDQRQSFSRWSTLLALLLFLAPGAISQVRNQTPLDHNVAATNSDDTGLTPGQKQDLQNKFNLQRQEEIKKDTDKLLQLATELKQSVDKSSQNTLSLDVIKKAEQIEKLAKTVKDKMKGP